jgi:hypothetical protein
MPTSANGWPVLDVAPPAITVPGCGARFRVLPGDVSVIFADLVHLFDRTVEDVDTVGHPGQQPLPKISGSEPSKVFDDWSWAYRPVRGQRTGFSNHASGTAIDLNATQHPRGAAGTFTRAQKRAVRLILSRYVDPRTGLCVVRWGEDYVTTVDGMHFEINAGPDAVERVVDKLRRLELPVPVPGSGNGKTSTALPYRAPTIGDDMHIWHTAGEQDDRVFLVVGDRKWLIPDPATLRDLRAAGVPDRGDAPARVLNLFPTVPDFTH